MNCFGEYIRTEPYVISKEDEKEREYDPSIPIVRHQAILIGNTNAPNPNKDSDEEECPF